jgi:hypothetical protein
MSILRIKSAPNPSLPLAPTLPFPIDVNNILQKVAEKYKSAQPIGDICPTPYLSLCSWVGKLKPEFQSLNLAGYGLSGLNQGLKLRLWTSESTMR